ncbi:MAG: TonB family protein [Bacteroidota bacterium]
MKYSFLIILLLFCSATLKAQKISDKIPQSYEYASVDREPASLNYYLITDKIGYPVEALKRKLEGKVYTRVLVSPKGEVEKYIMSRVDHPEFEKAVEEEIENLRFVPAKRNDSLVYHWINIPFKFYLNSSPKAHTQKLAYRSLAQKVFKSNRKKAAQILEQGVEFFDKREYKLAGKNFKQAIQATPNPRSSKSHEVIFQSRYYLGHCYLQLKDWERAITQYTEAVGIARTMKKKSDRVNEILPKLYLGKAYALLKSEDLVRALAMYNYVSKNMEEQLTLPFDQKSEAGYPWKTDKDWIAYQKGLLYLQLNQVESSMKYFAEVVDYEPASSLKNMALSHLGLAKSKLGNFEGAFNDIQTAIEMDEDDPQPYFLKAMILMELENQTMAEELLEQAKALFVRVDQKFDVPSIYPANDD